MNKIAFLLIGLLSMNIIAQKSVNINEDFDAIRIAAGLQVELFTDAEENKIMANEKVFEVINYKVRDNQLRIASSIETLLEGNVPLSLKIYVKKLSNLNVIQGSGVEFKKVFSTEHITLRAGEGSTISADIDVNSIDVKVLTGGLIEITGTAESQNIEIKTGGEYEARGLKTKSTNVQISYGGNARIYVTENCEAKIIVGGTIDVYGKPKFVNEKINFGGEINFK